MAMTSELGIGVELGLQWSPPPAGGVTLACANNSEPISSPQWSPP